MAVLQQVYYKINVKEYLEGEKVSDVRHEYIDGRVYAMAGGTRNHNLIAGNIYSSLNDTLSESPCTPFMSDVKVRVQALECESFYYPDVVVACEPDDNNELYIESPAVIIEVLSDSTERIDKTEKFYAYRSLDSLQEYVLVSQKSKEVSIAKKVNNWKLEHYTGEDFDLMISSIDQSISSERIFRNVTF